MQNNMFYLQKEKFEKMSLNKFYGRALIEIVLIYCICSENVLLRLN